MWQYAVVTKVDADHYNPVCQQWQTDGWSLEESNHYIANVQVAASPAKRPGAMWTLVFRKSGGPNLAEERMEEAHRMLRVVSDAMKQADTLPMLRKEIDDFLFKGSAGDM